MEDRRLLERAQSEVTARNRRVARALSLIIDIADQDGSTGLQQERDRLNGISRDLWERTINPLNVGDRVLIKPKTPVGLELGEPYVTPEKPIPGTLTSVSGLYGYDSHPLIEPLFKVSVELPQVENQTPETTTLLVPNDLLTGVVPQESTGTST